MSMAMGMYDEQSINADPTVGAIRECPVAAVGRVGSDKAA
jgi:hypothetical protein